MKFFAKLPAIAVFSIFSLQASHAAEIGLNRQAIAGTSPALTVAAVIISGQIEKGDAKKVETLLDEIKRTDDGHQLRRLLIHSPGGYIGEAMDIGRLIRANGVEIFLPQQLSCVSACVLVLAGGNSRILDGKVGLDHPHFLKPAGPNDDVPKLLAESKQIMRDYFEAMGVAKELADAMYLLPNGQIRYLNKDELAQYRLLSTRKN
jgi:hypothetical protein